MTPSLALKRMGDDRVGGYLVVWGSAQQKDLTGEYFTPKSELGLDWYDRRPVLYHHGLDGTLKATVIGVIDTLKTDDAGLWAEAQLDMRNRYVQAVQRLVDRGALGWSSGSLPHLVVVEDDGFIKRWPIVEGSLTPSPAEPRISVSNLKSLWDELELADVPMLDTELGSKHLGELPALKSIEGIGDVIDLEGLAAKADAVTRADETEGEVGEDIAGDTTGEEVAAAGEANDEAADKAAGDPSPPPTQKSEEKPGPSEEATTMDMIKTALATVYGLMEVKPTDEQNTQIYTRVKAIVAERAGVDEPPQPAVKTAFADTAFLGNVQNVVKEILGTTEELANGIKTAFGKVIEKPRSAGFTGSGANAAGQGQKAADVVVYSKYHDLTAEDMSFLDMLSRAARRGKNGSGGKGFSIHENADERVKFLREFGDKVGKSYDAHEVDLDEVSVVGIKAIKSDELNHSTQATFGDEWVPDLWSAQLWRRARIDNNVAPLFRMIEMPSNPYELPIEGTDPTVYYVPETASEAQLLLSGAGNPTPDSKVGSGKVQMSARKLSLRVGFSQELVEDSIIPVISIYREQAQRAMQDSLDFVLINGDQETGASGNVNSDDGAPAATDKFLAVNGLLRSAIVDGTGMKVDAGGAGAAVTLTKIRDARFAMPGRHSLNPNNLAMIVGAEVYPGLLNMDEFLTMDKVGAMATALNGQLGVVDGMPVITTAELATAEADGKINTASPSSTLFGRLIVVYRPNWFVGYRRRVAVSVDYLPYYDSYQLTSTARLAFARFDASSAAVLYDLAV